ncbi:hypothetical protein HDU92_007662, partial [Lobulomyces angularis]
METVIPTTGMNNNEESTDFFNMDAFIVESEKRDDGYKELEKTTPRQKPSTPSFDNNSTNTYLINSNSTPNFRETEKFSLKFITNAGYGEDLLNFGTFGLATVLDKVLDKMKLIPSGTVEENEETNSVEDTSSLIMKIKTQNGVISEISKRLQQTQKLLKDTQDYLQTREQTIKNMEEQKLIAELVNAQVESNFQQANSRSRSARTASAKVDETTSLIPHEESIQELVQDEQDFKMETYEEQITKLIKSLKEENNEVETTKKSHSGKSVSIVENPVILNPQQPDEETKRKSLYEKKLEEAENKNYNAVTDEKISKEMILEAAR